MVKHQSNTENWHIIAIATKWEDQLKKLKYLFHNLKFRNKTMVAFLCVSMIPLFLLGSFCFFETRALLSRQAKSSLKASLEQTALSINNQIENYNKISNALCYNKSLAIAANTYYESTYSMYEQLNDTIDELFITTGNLAPGIQGIALYTGTNLPKHGKTVFPLEYAKAFPWYSSVKDSVTVQWFLGEDRLLCIQPILYTKITNPQKNIVVMDIRLEQVLLPAQVLAEGEIEIYISDAKGNLIYTSSSAKPVSKITVMESFIPAPGWDIALYIPNSKLYQSASLISFTVFIMVLFCFLLVLLSSRLFSRKIVYRIEKLRENMATIEKGTLKVVVVSDSSDEIGQLTYGFGEMVKEIQRLIEENYTAQIQRKEFEMKALQAQINPHFLYNSLSLINWRALRIHADDISQMAQLLSSFYRTTLNKGKNLISVSEELLNVQSYLNIQLIMHSNSFDVEYQLDDSIYPYMMPNLMFQPLVENAILHGIENNEKIRGKLLLSCHIEDGCLLCIVKDNGIGIPAEEVPLILETNSKGYGIKNVNDRIKLLFGDSYGLTIQSQEGKGTTAILKMPVTEHDQ